MVSFASFAETFAGFFFDIFPLLHNQQKEEEFHSTALEKIQKKKQTNKKPQQNVRKEQTATKNPSTRQFT